MTTQLPKRAIALLAQWYSVSTTPPRKGISTRFGKKSLKRQGQGQTRNVPICCGLGITSSVGMGEEKDKLSIVPRRVDDGEGNKHGAV